MEQLVQLLGLWGILGGIGFVLFLIVYKYSVQIFEWIENQTYGTRTYIMEQAELLFWELNPEHVTYVLLGCSFGLGAFVLLLMGVLGQWLWGFILAGILSFLGWKLPKPLMNYLVERRINDYSNQMVDALTLLANGIRAGLSVPQAIGMASDEMPEPISQEFNLILQQNRIGVPLEECLENLAKRVPTEDNDMFVSSINILRETGGNLAETFDTIVGVIRERVRLKQKVDTYTAQGKFQGFTIAAMPFGMLAVFGASDPDSVVPLFTQPLGIAVLLVGTLLDAIGLAIILKIVKIKI